MDTVLNFMDKIYGDSSTLSMIYIVGAILLFVFIVLLIFSLRKPNDKKIEKIMEDPTVKDEPKVETQDKEIVVDSEETKIESVIKTEPVETENKDLSSILDSVEKKEEVIEEKIEEVKQEEKEVEIPNLSSEIPNVDDFVDNVVKKTYEKNEQFSSVFVGDNTSTIKLDKVLDKMNVEEDIKEEIVPEDEKTVVKEENIEEVPLNDVEEKKEDKKEREENNINSKLDALKKSLEEKNKEVSNKQDDLKAKLENLKKTNENKINLEDLASKLNMK